MENLDSLTDNESWILETAHADHVPRSSTVTPMSARLENGRLVLPLPADTVQLSAFPATRIERNALGAVHAQLAVDWANYEVVARPGAPGQTGYAPPAPEDSAVPLEERAALERVVDELGLRELPPAERLRRIENHLGAFTYATYRERPVVAGETALSDFLKYTRTGHCEYFATAATLLARAAGVPARYATGYAAIEYSSLEGAWVVRARHAHAWSRAWVDGRWRDLDTTPAAWGTEEADEAPIWQGLADLFRYAGFRWSQRGEFKAGDAWYAVLALLALYLGWSVLRGRRVVRERKTAAAARRSWPGADSEFYELEKSLPSREPSETHAAWLGRIGHLVPAERSAWIDEALRLHQRYRFDPHGISAAQRIRLRDLCRGLAAPA